jgi:hypothetical protein
MIQQRSILDSDEPSQEPNIADPTPRTASLHYDQVDLLLFVTFHGKTRAVVDLAS